MFDTGRMAVLAERLDPELLSKLKPVTLAQDRLIEVPEVLKPLVPWGGLQRGTSVAFDGVGSWSLAMAVMAVALGGQAAGQAPRQEQEHTIDESSGGGWMAVVGVPSFNLAAAAGFGVRLDRLLVVEDPGPGRWATVVATLLESVDLVAVAPGVRVGDRDRRRLSARAREQESVLVHLDGGRTWPSLPDLTFQVEAQGWEGIGAGHGHLQRRRATVAVRGRRTGVASGGCEVWLPNEHGHLAPCLEAENLIMQGCATE